ncbi:MAG TPA: transposase, partial [Bryobacteraceae bacterium]|nr:transposase [Bryobacteraceae bacterium]
FLRGISTRQVGRIVATFTGEPVSAQTVSKLTRELDQAVRKFHQAPLNLFLDGVSLRVRRPAGRKRVQRLVAYGVRRDGRRQLLAFQRSSGESQAAWEGLLQDLYRRGLVSFFRFPKPLWRQLRTTNIMERVFVEVRRRTRPMVCFVNVASVDRIIYSIFQRFNLEWRNRTLRVFTQTA